MEYLDRSFWYLHTATTPQHIGCLGLLSGRPDFRALLRRFAHILELFPRLRDRVSQKHSKHLRGLSWEVMPGFDLQDQVTYVYSPQIKTQQDLLAVSADIFAAGLKLDHPLWSFTIISNEPQSGPLPGDKLESHSAFLIVLHHSLTDGLGGLRILTELCTHESDADIHPHTHKERVRSQPLPRAKEHHGWSSTKKLIKDFTRKNGETALHGTNSARRDITVFDLPLDQLRKARLRAGGSLNDLLLAIIAEGARRFDRFFGLSPSGYRAIVPVNLRERDDSHSLGNHLTAVGIPLPINQEAPLATVSEISDYIRRLKELGGVGAYARFAKSIAMLPKWLQRQAGEALGKRSTFICTNVPWTSSPLYLAGAQLQSTYALPALLRTQGTGFAFMSYANKLCIGMVSDPAIINSPELLNQFLQSAAHDMIDYQPRKLVVKERRRGSARSTAKAAPH
jgi:diacylglycerol O-acyltransferase / wax synthase